MKNPRNQNKRRRRRAETLRLLLAALLCLSLCACGSGPVPERPAATPRPSPAAAPTAAPATPAPTPEPEPEETPARTAPAEALTIACTPFSGRWDPFDDAEGSDRMLLRLTQTPVLCRNADGSFPETAEGVGAAGLRVTVRGDGSAVLRIAMRENVRFADGSYADADDLLFTLYVLLDPDYDGALDLRRCAVSGLRAYRTGTGPETLEKAEALYAEAAAGEGELAELAAFCLREAWGRSLRALTELCRDRYLDTYASYALGMSPEEAWQEPGALRAFVLWCAGLADAADDGGVMTDRLGNRWKPGSLPEEDDLIALFDAWFGSAGAFDKALGMETEALAEESFIRRFGAADPDNEPARRISGITRIDDYTVELLLDEFSPEDPERLGRLWLLPMPVYGDESLFRPEEGLFGFPYGDLSGVRTRAKEQCIGAGAFRIAEGGEELRLEANLYYYGGSSKVGEIWFETGPEEALLGLVSEGSADLACLPGSPAVFAEARSLPGLAIRSVATDIWGVLTRSEKPAREPEETEPEKPEQEETEPEEPGPEEPGKEEPETKVSEPEALGDALLRLAAVCCRASAADYFGGAAMPVNTEETEETALEKVRQALSALPPRETPVFTALVPDRGDHPCFGGLQRAAELLAELGVELQLRVFDSDGEYWAAVDGGEGDLWVSAERLRRPPEPDGTLGPDRRLIYRRLDLLALSSERFELLSLPVELTWARDHISVAETLELK